MSRHPSYGKASKSEQKRNVLKRIGDFFGNLRWPKWMRKLNPFEKEMRSNMGGKKWRQYR